MFRNKWFLRTILKNLCLKMLLLLSFLGSNTNIPNYLITKHSSLHHYIRSMLWSNKATPFPSNGLPFKSHGPLKFKTKPKSRCSCPRLHRTNTSLQSEPKTPTRIHQDKNLYWPNPSHVAAVLDSIGQILAFKVNQIHPTRIHQDIYIYKTPFIISCN